MNLFNSHIFFTVPYSFFSSFQLNEYLRLRLTFLITSSYIFIISFSAPNNFSLYLPDISFIITIFQPSRSA
jgi:hypothetical protein